jgi:thiamine pyrophosphokinase
LIGHFPPQRRVFVLRKRALIFLNGEMKDGEKIRSLFEPGDYLVAVDGGLRHLRLLGIAPHLLIGDLDSVRLDDMDWADSQNAKIIRYPVEKNETDFELAVKAVQEKGIRTIRVIAALGGRLDQTLGNIFLLLSEELVGCDIVLDDGCEEVFFIRKRSIIRGRQGDVVSLLPYREPVTGVKTTGLQYPLYSETLFPHRSRGISNIMTAEEAIVNLEGGVLICVHTRVN